MTAIARPARTPVFAGDLLEAARAKIAEYPHQRSAVMPLLHMLQDATGHVTREGMREIAALLDLTPAEVLGTASFYTMYKLEPIGDHLVSICGGMSCMLAGAHEMYEKLLDRFGVQNLETTDDGRFTFEEMECAAACGGAPVIEVDYRFFEYVPVDGAAELVEEIDRLGLDAVHIARGSVSAPLPPLDVADINDGPSPKSGPARPPAEPDSAPEAR